jgi:hypothetical protein
VAIKMQRTPIALPKDLNDFALVAAPSGPPPARLTNLVYRDPSGKYELQHSREWQFIGERNGQRVLRLISPRGDWVADATLMPWKGPKMDTDALKQLLESSPGWEQDDESKVDVLKHPAGYAVSRIAAAGKLEGVAAFRASYYLVSPKGEQMIVTIVAPPGQVNTLEARDTTLVESIELK